MTKATMEQKLAALEREVAELRAIVESMKTQPKDGKAWVDSIFGKYKDDESHAEAVRLGLEYRKSLDRKPAKRKRKART
ncbi:MAG: hypothetical protein K2X38_00600 [Gemmataceae bacterium]|nr:hypothetical protein [Gemmataceae bacterium]